LLLFYFFYKKEGEKKVNRMERKKCKKLENGKQVPFNKNEKAWCKSMKGLRLN